MKVSELFDFKRPFWIGFFDGLAMMPLWRFIGRIFNDPTDPVRHCDLYKSEGCAHVDGFLCDMKTCKELAEYRAAPQPEQEG